MARICEISGKSVMVGYNVSHAHNKTKKKSFPNLHTIRIVNEDGTRIKIKVAASTIRTLKKKRK